MSYRDKLRELRDLVEQLTRIDYMHPELRAEVKQLLIDSYQKAEGLFQQLDKAIAEFERKLI